MSPRLTVGVAALAALAASAALAALARPAAAQTAGAAARGAYVTVLGTDTIAVEEFTRTADRVEGDVIQRQGGTVVTHYVFTPATAGAPARLEYAVRRADGSAIANAPKSVTVLYGRDTVTTITMRDTAITRRVAAAGVTPLMLNSMFGLYQPVIVAMRTAERDTATLSVYSPNAGQTSAIPFRFLGGDSVRVWYFGDPQILRFDAQGEVTSLDARHTTNKILVTRVASVDIPALAKHFAALDAAGRGLSRQASPRDTVRASVAGAAMLVDYGRPFLRGRDVWAGRGVLGDTLWRTGANAATHLRTDRDLVVAGRTVPAGLYTLWTHAGASGWELIFSKKTGQWGTEYDAAQDLVRVPLTAGAEPAPVEQFTIGVEPQGPGGVIRLRWGSRQLSVPFTVK